MGIQCVYVLSSDDDLVEFDYRTLEALRHFQALDVVLSMPPKHCVITCGGGAGLHQLNLIQSISETVLSKAIARLRFTIAFTDRVKSSNPSVPDNHLPWPLKAVLWPSPSSARWDCLDDKRPWDNVTLASI
jgi:hypothetical protein